MADMHKGKCFCGAVEIEVTGSPEMMGYCHCESCRSWSAGPVNAFTLWRPETVKVTKGKDQLGMFAKNPSSERQFCKKCGGHVMTEHPRMRLIDVYANLLRGYTHQPTLHVNYASKTLSVKDGLPKYADFPSDLGGSGEKLPD